MPVGGPIDDVHEVAMAPWILYSYENSSLANTLLLIKQTAYYDF